MRSKDSELLMHDHAELGDLLGQLVSSLETDDIARSYATLDLFWARLAVHIRAEHLHLFPTIEHAASRSLTAHRDDVSEAREPQKIIEELRHDHDFFMRELSQAVAVMRALSANPKGNTAEQLEHVRKRIDAVQARLAKHNEIEEEGIYLWTESLLSETEQSRLAALMKKELENRARRFDVVAALPEKSC